MNPYPLVPLNHFTVPFAEALARGPEPLLPKFAMRADAVPDRKSHERADSFRPRASALTPILRKRPADSQRGMGRSWPIFAKVSYGEEPWDNAGFRRPTDFGA